MKSERHQQPLHSNYASTEGLHKEITMNGLLLSYHDMGRRDAAAIILIHGFPLNKSMWDKQIQMLQGEFRVIAYDIRGHGESEAGSVDYSIELFVNDLLCLMETLGLERAILCGFSMGGYIALNAVERFPERFEALILSDTQCTADSPEVRDGRIATMDSILENGVEAFADDMLQKLFAPASFVRHRSEVAAVREMIVNTTSESLCNTLFALAARKETRSKLMEIGIPTLILVGKEDQITPVAASQLMHGRIRGSKFAIIGQAGHLSNLENPEVFNQHLLEFVAPFADGRGAVGKLA